jgi:ligand-binding sensor domain-containing protein
MKSKRVPIVRRPPSFRPIVSEWILVSLLAILGSELPAQGHFSGGYRLLSISAQTSVAVLKLKTRNAPMQLLDGADVLFRQIQSVNGLSQTRAGATVQDRLGFLWFGTQYGLNRFDGYRFKAFRHVPGQPNSLGGVYVRSLFVDHSGTLWVGCDQSLDRFDPVTETFTHFRIALPGTNVNYGPAIHITEDQDGKLWLATARGLFRFDPSNGKAIRYTHDPGDPTSLSANDVNFTEEDRRGQFWVASGGGLDAFDRKTGKVTLHIPLEDHSPFTFHEDRFGLFWIGRDSPQCPLAVLDRDNNTLTCFSIYEESRKTTPLAGIYSMLESREGTMWMATSRAGLLTYDRSHKRLIRYKNHPDNSLSLSADSAINLYEDYESNVWVDLHETAPNFFSEKPPPFQNFTHQGGQLKGSLVTSIIEDRNRTLWLGSTGALNRIDRSTNTNTASPGIGAFGEVLTIIEDPSGNLIAGTFWRGLQQLNPTTGQTRPYHRYRGKLSNQSDHPIMRLYIDHHGTLWAATWGGLRRLDSTSGDFTTYKPDPQDTIDYSDIKEDSNGTLWLGGESGLQSFDPTTEKFTIYKHDPDDPHSVSDHRVTSVFIDHAGRMWLGTQNGFDRFDPKSGTAKVYYETDGLAGNVVSCILEDERGSLWMGTNNGLSSFDPQTEKFRNYSVADGLPGPDLTGWSTCFKSPRGEMFFGGFSGATAFYPGKLGGSSFIPRTVLTDFRLAGNSVPIGLNSPLHKSIIYTKSITLSHEQNIFSIEFSALSYFNALTNRYRYRLEGLESQWHEVGSDQRVASYTTLPKGKYTFHVEGATGRGAWDEPGAVLEIEILPPWWGTWWFTVISITLLLLFVLSAYLYRSHQIALQFALRLEERVNERTRLARELHDTLLQTIQSSKMVADDALSEETTLNGMRVTMKNLSKWLGQATEEGRAALDSLRHPATQGHDLLDALQRVAQEFETSSSTKIDFSVVGTIRKMNPNLLEEVYRIVCEGIRNACLHSEGSQISIEIRYATDLILRVGDNGKGFSPEVAAEGKQGHFGLQGMKERATKIGGEFNLLTSASGTQITLRIPGSLVFNEADLGASNLLARLQTWWRRIQG